MSILWLGWCSCFAVFRCDYGLVFVLTQCSHRETLSDGDVLPNYLPSTGKQHSLAVHARPVPRGHGCWSVKLSLTDSLYLVQLFATPWTVAYQAPLSKGFPRQEYWNGWPFPSPGDLLDPEIKPRSPALQVDSLPSEPLRSPYMLVYLFKKINK